MIQIQWHRYIHDKDIETATHIHIRYIHREIVTQIHKRYRQIDSDTDTYTIQTQTETETQIHT